MITPGNHGQVDNDYQPDTLYPKIRKKTGEKDFLSRFLCFIVPVKIVSYICANTPESKSLGHMPKVRASSPPAPNSYSSS